jgi:hypothetical protein
MTPKQQIRQDRRRELSIRDNLKNGSRIHWYNADLWVIIRQLNRARRSKP